MTALKVPVKIIIQMNMYTNQRFQLKSSYSSKKFGRMKPPDKNLIWN